MGAHGGESPTHKANARRHVAHATVGRNATSNRTKHITEWIIKKY